MKTLITRKDVLFFLLMITGTAGYAQHHFFTDVPETTLQNGLQKRPTVPSKFRSLILDTTAILNFFKTVAAEGTRASRAKVVLEIPMPKGDTGKFFIWESSTMSPALAAKYPGIKSYTGQGITDPAATIKVDWTEFGFHAMVLSPVSGPVFIDPYTTGNSKAYISYFKEDLKKNGRFIELMPKGPDTKSARGSSTTNVSGGSCRGSELYSYRLAIACTHEYAIAATGFSNPTILQTLGRIVTTLNRVNGIYERELSVRMVLVGTEDKVIFTREDDDPFTGNQDAYTLINESQQVIDSAIGSGNYDIGHTFSTGEQGLADIGVICNAENKAHGITGREDPTGDAYDIDFVAHEIGHQLGASHTFNGVEGNCSGDNREQSTAYEPGSGTTIMGYAGICNNDNLQPNTDPFFHAISFFQISNTLDNNGCGTVTRTGNTLPQITAMHNNDASIPLNTPFILTAEAVDADADALTYSWEEWDVGDAGPWNSGANSDNAPLFKSREPSTSGSRTFPDMAVILAGYPKNPAATMNGLKGETLPLVARDIKFTLTVRDNHAGSGGVVSGGDGCQQGFTDEFRLHVVANTGPFVITAPNGSETWGTNTAQTIRWNTAGTARAPINCANVTIQLSTDGGHTYPVTLLANTPNDGSQEVVIPANVTTSARIRVMASNNVFFDISNNDFSISGPCVTIANGNWDDPSTWLNGVVPTAGTQATVQHAVNVTANAACYSLNVEPAGSVTVKADRKLDITH